MKKILERIQEWLLIEIKFIYTKKIPDTGSWDRLRDSGGNDVKIAVEDLNKFHEELSSTGAYSKDYNEISETLKKKRF